MKTSCNTYDLKCDNVLCGKEQFVKEQEDAKGWIATYVRGDRDPMDENVDLIVENIVTVESTKFNLHRKTFCCELCFLVHIGSALGVHVGPATAS